MVDLPVLSLTEERMMLAADQAMQDQPPPPPPPGMQERIRLRLRAAVHDRFTVDAMHASAVGDPVSEHVIHCAIPDADPCGSFKDLGDGAGRYLIAAPSFRRREHPYPYRLGPVRYKRRARWMADHEQRLQGLLARDGQP